MSRYQDHYQVAQGVWGLKIVFVNIYMIAHRNGEETSWILIDAGLKGSGRRIIEMAALLFGEQSEPSAIVLTHGHFDHVGALPELLEHWDMPVFAHRLELPYLTGRSAYPPADPTVGGGLVSLLSWLYPTGGIDLGNRVNALEEHDKVPFAPEWRVIHTPGHSAGHISIYRQLNATLIAGDAFVTTKNESLFYALSYKTKLSGPPRYFTTNWQLAEASFRKLAALQPRIAATGHGKVMMGNTLRIALHELEAHFSQLAIPAHGRYVNSPAQADEHGVTFVPPFKAGPKFTAGVFLGAILAGWMIMREIKNAG